MLTWERADHMLKIENLKVSYQGISVIHDVSFKVKERDLTVIIGANGVGKTTILKSIMGIHRPDSGHIWIHDEDLTKVPAHKVINKGISICPEGRQLFPDMTVRENLEMGAYIQKDKNTTERNIKKMFEKFPILYDRRMQKASTLSGGEQEILAIARALVIDPEVLLLDEPSWGLAPLMIEEVMQIVVGLQKESDITILLVEQNASIALKYANYAYLIDNGKVALEGTGEELMANKRVQEVYLGG